jgi:hypothetical protein
MLLGEKHYSAMGKQLCTYYSQVTIPLYAHKRIKLYAQNLARSTDACEEDTHTVHAQDVKKAYT